MKTYKEIVSDVQAKNPGLSMKDVQIAASEIFQQAKKAADEAKEFTKPPVIPAQNPGFVKQAQNANLADAVDAAIRVKGIDQHNIMSVARAFDPNFVMVKGERDGVNTKCWLEGPCRVPASGHYLIFL